MASKKYSFLVGVLSLLASTGFAQMTTTSGSGYDVADSTVVPAKGKAQQTEFMQGTYNFPAKPRSQVEIGVKVGSFALSSDVPARLPGLGFGAHIRKAIGYVFSLRLEYMYGMGKGLNWNASSNFVNNPAYTRNGYTQANSPRVFYNYKTTVQDLALEGLFTLNNVRFHKSKSGVALYLIAGVGATTYDTKVNALNASGQRYNFSSITGYNDHTNRKNVKDQLKSLMDDTYETPAENDGNRRAKVGGNTVVPVGHFGAGIAFKLNNRINLAIEDRYSISRTDLLDGQRWAEQVNNNPVLTPDYDNYNYATVGLNFNLGAKSVQPLYWLNPLDYAYQEIRKPRLMILPKPVLPDTDGDGVTDQFDQEVTPQGCPVDAHGVSLDTDGDGVPDCRDKEKVTPTTCQPVDADGVGKCPVACPDSTCPNYGGGTRGGGDCAAIMGNMPPIQFAGNSTKLNESQKVWLAGLAAKLRNSPDCRLNIVGYCAETNKAKQASGAARAENVRKYLVESEGLSNDRITVLLAQEGGDCNTIDLKPAQ